MKAGWKSSYDSSSPRTFSSSEERTRWHETRVRTTYATKRSVKIGNYPWKWRGIRSSLLSNQTLWFAAEFLRQNALVRDSVLVVVNKQALTLCLSSDQSKQRSIFFGAYSLLPPIMSSNEAQAAAVDTQQVCKLLDEITASMSSARETIQSLQAKYVAFLIYMYISNLHVEAHRTSKTRTGFRFCL